MDEIDQAVLRIMRDGIPLLEEPFMEVANKAGISQEEVMARLRRLIRSGVVRRFGASVNHEKIGIVANALVAWKAPRSRVEEIGSIMSNYEEITHCYERKTIPEKWEHNLYTVVHGYDRESVQRFIKRLSKSIGLDEYLILFSSRRFKRLSVTPPECGHSKKGVNQV